MSVKTVRVVVPASFVMEAHIYSQATNQRDERYIEAPPNDLLVFAFSILEHVFRASMGKP